MPTVIAIFGNNARSAEKVGACEIYRVTMPLTHLSEFDKDWETGWVFIDQIEKKELIQQLILADIVVLPRWWTSQENLEGAKSFFETLRLMNKRIVYECDDDYSNIHREVHTGGDSSIVIASVCDAITVSTPYLKQWMEKLTGKKVYVAPNFIDRSLWDAYANMSRPENLTIGLAGTKTHYNDWIVLKDILPGILRDFPDVRLQVVHFHPDYIQYMDNPHILIHPGARYLEYPAVINQIDVLLCPVDPDDPFNWSKSGIKAIEGMASKRLVRGKWAGACVLATDMPIYRREINNRHNGLLVKHTPEAWDKAIREVIQDGRFRERLQITGYKSVSRRYITNNWQVWRTIYKKILED
jgi:glycosyltransferase involved in cell wall biosynthesis